MDRVVFNERVRFCANFLLALSVALIGIGVADVVIQGFAVLNFGMAVTGLAFQVWGTYILGMMVPTGAT